MRKTILGYFYNNMYADTKMVAKEFGITTEEAYSNAKWLEDNGFLQGESTDAEGNQTKRGTYRSASILWYALYNIESDGIHIEFKELDEVIDLLKEKMKFSKNNAKGVD